MTNASLLLVLSLVGTVFTMVTGKGNFRLPDTLAPSHYWLKLMPTFEEEGFLTRGEVKIAILCDQATDQVIFNQNGINITSVRMTTVSGLAINIREQKIIEDKQMYELKLDSMLDKGHTYYLEMIFSYSLNDQLEGFYKSSYKDESENLRWLATTQFSPINARRAFPCWDEPSFKAKFSISLGRSVNMTSLSNMERYNTSVMIDREGWLWDHYQETPTMSTYLLAFIVCDLPNKVVANTTSPLFKVWSRKEILKEMDYVANISPKLLAYIAEYFQIPFPLQKIDLFAVPDFGFSAMENWGLITFAESAIKNPKTIAHELAHQWFGNLVTPEWWEDLWLKEGFATFIGIVALSHVDNSTEAVDKWIVNELQHSLFEDSLGASHPVSNPVDDPRMIWQAFDAISYEKGSAIIRMMCAFLGENLFRKGLNSYLKNHSYSNARREQLWQAYENITDVNVGKVMDGWTLQVGYPVVTVKRDYSSASVTLMQERFLLSGKVDGLESLWNIPVVYRTKSDSLQKKHLVWLEEKEKSFTVDHLTKDDWILVNLEQTGYFRVNYDCQNWNMLLEAFQELPRLSKSELINDAFNLAISGQLTYDIPLSFVERISDVDDILLWNVTTTELRNIVYLLNKTPLLSCFKILQKLLEFGWDVVPCVPYLPDQINSNSILKVSHVTWKNLSAVKTNYSLSNEYGQKEFIISKLPLTNLNDAANSTLMTFAIFLDEKNMVNLAIDIVKKMIEKKETATSISKELRYLIYCAAIRHGNQETWNSIWARFIAETEPEEKIILMLSLGCSQNEEVLKKLLKGLLIDESGIRKQDAKYLFDAVARNQVGADLALDFLCVNWNGIKQRYGLGYKIMSTMVQSLSFLLNQEAQYKKLHDLYIKNMNDLGSTSNAFKNSLERIDINIRWQKKNYNLIEEWIKKRK